VFALAESADQANVPDEVSLPEEIKRRQDRLAAMARAESKIAERAAERHAREQAGYEQKMAARAAKEERTGKKPGGKPPQPPQPPQPGARAHDQVNLTDEDSRIMAGGGFNQTYNAQAAVDAPSMLVVGTGVTQAPNDKEQIEPMLHTLPARPQTQAALERLIADTGFFSQTNIQACAAAQNRSLDPCGARVTANPRCCLRTRPRRKPCRTGSRPRPDARCMPCASKPSSGCSASSSR